MSPRTNHGDQMKTFNGFQSFLRFGLDENQCNVCVGMIHGSYRKFIRKQKLNVKYTVIN
jgi:hypothetical protein